LLTHLQTSGMGDLLARALAEEPFPLPACARSDAMPAEAVAGWWHFFQAMRQDSLAAEVTRARLAAAGGEAGALARLAHLREAQLDLLNDDPVPGPS
jgi:DNA primase